MRNRESLEKAGHHASVGRVGINSHGFIAETAERASELAFPPYLETCDALH